MTGLDEIKVARLKKLDQLLKAGINPYPADAPSLITLGDAQKKFAALKKKKSITLVGRIKARRGHGGSLFCDIFDGQDKFQIYLKRDELGGDQYNLFESAIDIGDYCLFSGRLFATKKREKTLLASLWQILAKSLRPLPEKWHGLQDVEERFRKRYLDLLSNPEVREQFEKRSRIIAELRQFLAEEGFEEVETPILHPVAGGATARPFETHHNALDIDLYLRIAPELYLKKLLIGGMKKVYELGRMFRNEGIDATHNPEFTELELYEAFADARKHTDLIEKLFRRLAQSVNRSLIVQYQDQNINLGKKFARITFEDALGRFALINNYQKISDEEFIIKAKRFGIDLEQGDTKAKIADKIFKKICRPKIIQPTFVEFWPLEVLPLAKESKKYPGTADMYQLIVGGLELAKGFSELNDPLLQRKRFEEQEAMRKAGDEEANRLDEDFLEALEYGMPPAAGLGIGIDRLAMLLTNSSNIREVIFFPTMRPK